MEKDIKFALDLGFNGSRLHQKVFDPRFLYLCDKLGYMVWGEFPSWGVDYSNLDFIGQYLAEWTEVLKRDFNHPSIIIWCPLNEVWGTWEDGREKRDIRFVDIVYNYTKTFDPTRPCVDASGGIHGHKTDFVDFHCYEDLPTLKKYLDELEKNGSLNVPFLYDAAENLSYDGKLPVHLSEVGGICFTPQKAEDGLKSGRLGMVTSEEEWGYGKGETSGEAFVERYRELIDLIYKYNKLFGFCYTQLYDVEQERNGFYNYDRTDKLSESLKLAIKKINNQR
ncbi:MAG: glycoside hydrolase family 2 TIM barrel-domain containing protein [Bacilli bacterium]